MHVKHAAQGVKAGRIYLFAEYVNCVSDFLNDFIDLPIVLFDLLESGLLLSQHVSSTENQRRIS